MSTTEQAFKDWKKGRIDGPSFRPLRALPVAEENAHELNGDGSVILDGEEVGTVYYWLSIRPKPGRVIAEGLISGPEPVLKCIKKANNSKLALEDGPTLTIRCHGGRNGARWIKAVKSS